MRVCIPLCRWRTSFYISIDTQTTPRTSSIALNYFSLAEGGDLDNVGELFKSTSHVSSAASSVNEQGSYNDTSPTTTAGPSRSQLLARQRSYRAQTSAEVTELEKMITKAATTPRKAKRVCNMYVVLDI